ncbi:MAG: hypothetical protein MK137_02935 [Rickettsiales bacterium]|nr:hypothetical protein [Rickettsiales bacterium]
MQNQRPKLKKNASSSFSSVTLKLDHSSDHEKQTKRLPTRTESSLSSRSHAPQGSSIDEQLKTNTFTEVSEPDTNAIKDGLNRYRFSRNEGRKRNRKKLQLSNPFSPIYGDTRRFWQSTIASQQNPNWYESTPFLKKHQSTDERPIFVDLNGGRYV